MSVGDTIHPSHGNNSRRRCCSFSRPSPREAWVPLEAAHPVAEEVGGDRGVEGQGHGGEGSACGLAAWA